jgi:hypothetical protein
VRQRGADAQAVQGLAVGAACGLFEFGFVLVEALDEAADQRLRVKVWDVVDDV